MHRPGVPTFLAAADLSEYHSLSRDYRIDIAARIVGALPSDSCVHAGDGGSTADARDLIRTDDEVGVNAMMIMPPDHTYLLERGLLEYYRKLGEVTEMPLVELSAEVEALAEELYERLDGEISRLAG